MRAAIILFLACSTLCGQVPPTGYSDPQKIGVQNSILAKVNGTTISMMDVKKKLDILFFQNYPQLAGSSQARFQFYETSWRKLLTELVDNELILADATDREIKLSDAEVREELENRFGPNVMTTIDQIGITYDEAWKMIRKDMIVQRMSWWFIQAKAMAKVTPLEIRAQYRLYAKDHPASTEWKYKVLTIRGDDGSISKELYDEIITHNLSIEEIPNRLKSFEQEHPGCAVTLSSEYALKDAELSAAHRSALASLSPNSYGQPTLQASRDKQNLYRIFFLSEKIEHSTPTFEEMAPTIKNELLQKHSIEISQSYIGKLRKHYRFDPAHLEETIPADFKPFAIQ
jgi:hypothetical protein